MSQDTRIEVRDQAKLPLGKVVDLVRSGIKHRLLRSTLTMSVILLAVAFFMSSLAESSLINAVDRGVSAEIATQRSTPALLNHLYLPPNSKEASEYLGDIVDEPQRLAEAAAITGMSVERLEELATSSAAEQRYLLFFDDLSPGKRIALVDRARGSAIFAHLRDEEAMAAFSEQLQAMASVQLPDDDLEDFAAFVDSYPQLQESLEDFARRWTEASNSLEVSSQQLTDGMDLRSWLAAADDQQFASWRALVHEHGFEPEESHLSKLRSDLTLTLRSQEIQETLREPEKVTAWLKEFQTRSNLSEKMAMLEDERVAAILDNRYTLDELRAVKERRQYERELANLETGLTAAVGERREGSVLSGRQVFLLSISFVVCMVGIANAMLMAITERFREIATMKCLGATDGFILQQFMIEAVIQGVAGGVFGMVIGFLLTFLKALFSYGLYPVYYFPILPMIVCALVSLAIGIVLSVLASIYPSFMASRMAPMEAMRVE